MSDLYWDRVAAGHYETTYYSGKYRYKVIGEGITWECFYMYKTKNLSKRVWKRLRYGHSDRMKQAKHLCVMHNMKPRIKFQIVGREFKKYKQADTIVFAEVNDKGELSPWGRVNFELPAFYESYSGEVTYLGDEYLFGREAAITGENRYRLSDGSLVIPKFVEEEKLNSEPWGFQDEVTHAS